MVALMKERESWEREDAQVEYETDKLYHYEWQFSQATSRKMKPIAIKISNNNNNNNNKTNQGKGGDLSKESDGVH